MVDVVAPIVRGLRFVVERKHGQDWDRLSALLESGASDSCGVPGESLSSAAEGAEEVWGALGSASDLNPLSFWEVSAQQLGESLVEPTAHVAVDVYAGVAPLPRPQQPDLLMQLPCWRRSLRELFSALVTATGGSDARPSPSGSTSSDTQAAMLLLSWPSRRSSSMSTAGDVCEWRVIVVGDATEATDTDVEPVPFFVADADLAWAVGAGGRDVQAFRIGMPSESGGGDLVGELVARVFALQKGDSDDRRRCLTEIVDELAVTAWVGSPILGRRTNLWWPRLIAKQDPLPRGGLPKRRLGVNFAGGDFEIADDGPVTRMLRTTVQFYVREGSEGAMSERLTHWLWLGSGCGRVGRLARCGQEVVDGEFYLVVDGEFLHIGAFETSGLLLVRAPLKSPSTEASLEESEASDERRLPREGRAAHRSGGGQGSSDRGSGGRQQRRVVKQVTIKARYSQRGLDSKVAKQSAHITDLDQQRGGDATGDDSAARTHGCSDAPAHLDLSTAQRSSLTHLRTVIEEAGPRLARPRRLFRSCAAPSLATVSREWLGYSSSR
jgi:hypothetical protein